MSGLRLQLGTAADRLDCRELFAPGWESLDAAAMLRREVVVQGRRMALGEVARASGTPDGTAVLEGEWQAADWLGASMAAGTVEVVGSTGIQAGAGMSGGTLVIRGDAGDGVAGAFPGRKRGVTGGEVIVHGNVDGGAGRAMRRGLLVVGGSAGRAAGYSMLAGTIVCLGAMGTDAGLLNKRGSLVVAGRVAIPPVYRQACAFRPAYLAVILKRLRARHGLAIPDELVGGTWQRWSGDFAELGRGEILAWESA